MPTTRAASTPSRRAMRKEESKSSPFPSPYELRASANGAIRAEAIARTRKRSPQKRGVLSSCNSFATGITSVHAPSPGVKFASFYRPGTSPDGRIGIYMILAMISPAVTSQFVPRPADWLWPRGVFRRGIRGIAHCSSRPAPICNRTRAAAPQSPPASPASAAPSSTPPHPDKNRAQKAYQAGRARKQSGDWKAELADYTEAAAYDPSNREYKMLKEHARFQAIQSLVDTAERQAIAGNVPGGARTAERGAGD